MKRISLLLPLCVCAWMPVAAQQEQQMQAPADSVKNIAYIDSIFKELPEVMITGERPIVKAEQGKLVYDLPRLLGNLPVDNAYDAVKNLPGVMDLGEGLMLGGQEVTVVINGKVTTLSTGQLNALLKSIPVSRIEKAEVMYSAPARYQVRGAMINLVLASGTGHEPSFRENSIPLLIKTISNPWQSVEAFFIPAVNSLLTFFTLTLTTATGERRTKKRFTRLPTVQHIRWICMKTQSPVTTAIRYVSEWIMPLQTNICSALYIQQPLQTPNIMPQ